jgi:hypothetical protein
MSGGTKPDVSSYASDHQQRRGFGHTSEEPHPNHQQVQRRSTEGLHRLRKIEEDAVCTALS